MITIYAVGDFGEKTGRGLCILDENKVYAVGDFGDKTGQGVFIIDGDYNQLELVAILRHQGVI